MTERASTDARSIAGRCARWSSTRAPATTTSMTCSGDGTTVVTTAGITTAGKTVTAGGMTTDGTTTEGGMRTSGTTTAGGTMTTSGRMTTSARMMTGMDRRGTTVVTWAAVTTRTKTRNERGPVIA